MPTLDFLIPARNEKHLQKTIDDVLAHTGETTGVIVVLDGAWPMEPIPDNPRVTLIHHAEPRGQRASINEAARISKADFICKLDAHCSLAPGFDRVMLDAWESGELTEADTALGRMYNLDVEKWEPKLHKRTDYMMLTLNAKGELRAEYYKRQPDTALEIDETMACMGPCWMLSRDRFWKTGGCDENHGGQAGWGAQSVEVSCKVWLSGGRLMVNKRTWFAHLFRGDTGFPYPISGREVAAVRAYSKNLWLNDAWPGQVRPLKWLVEKFSPPGWESHVWEDKPLPVMDADERKLIQGYLYHNLHRKGLDCSWRGVRVVKMPSDLALYHKVIWQSKPEVIVEIGTRFGGSALFFQDQLDLLGDSGRVVTVDIRDTVKQPDPRITYLHGNSNSPDVLAEVGRLCAGKRVMVSVDGDHGRVHVKGDLYHYGPLVTPGQYLVVEDCFVKDMQPFGPLQARDWFLAQKRGKGFEQTNLDREQGVGICVGGWLRRRA